MTKVWQGCLQTCSLLDNERESVSGKTREDQCVCVCEDDEE